MYSIQWLQVGAAAFLLLSSVNFQLIAAPMPVPVAVAVVDADDDDERLLYSSYCVCFSMLLMLFIGLGTFVLFIGEFYVRFF